VVVLPELGESLGLYAQKKLRERRVEIQTGIRVLGYSGNRVELSSREAIKTATLIWTAGVTPASALKDLPCKKEKGRLVVDENLEVPEFPGVWAVGDCAWILNRKTGQPHPPTAQQRDSPGHTGRHKHSGGHPGRSEETVRVLDSWPTRHD